MKKINEEGGVRGLGLGSSPPSPRSISRAIFRAVFDSTSAFFAPKPHGNACYAGYQKVIIRLRIQPSLLAARDVACKASRRTLLCDRFGLSIDQELGRIKK